MKTKIVITVIIVLLYIIVWAASGILLVCVIAGDLEHDWKGIPTIIAFLAVTVCIGLISSGIIDRIKRLWNKD